MYSISNELKQLLFIYGHSDLRNNNIDYNIRSDELQFNNIVPLSYHISNFNFFFLLKWTQQILRTGIEYKCACGHCRLYDHLSKCQPPPHCVSDLVYLNCLCLANVHKHSTTAISYDLSSNSNFHHKLCILW